MGWIGWGSVVSKSVHPFLCMYGPAIAQQRQDKAANLKKTRLHELHGEGAAGDHRLDGAGHDHVQPSAQHQILADALQVGGFHLLMSLFWFGLALDWLLWLGGKGDERRGWKTGLFGLFVAFLPSNHQNPKPTTDTRTQSPTHCLFVINKYLPGSPARARSPPPTPPAAGAAARSPSSATPPRGTPLRRRSCRWP